MAKPKDTFAQRDFKIGDDAVAKGTDLMHLPANQLADFKMAGLVGIEPTKASEPAANG